MSNRLVQLEIYPLKIPFRGSFNHTLTSRDYNDTLVVAALLADGTIGYGEALPREYVTGETLESAIFNVEGILRSYLQKLEPNLWSDLLELADKLPCSNEQGQIINSARCAVELALLDAYGKYFGRSVSGIVDWLGFGAFSAGGSQNLRTSGLLDGRNPDKMLRRLRLMWWYGLRDFKLNVGYPNDLKMLRIINNYLGNNLSDKASLRVDANGRWDIDTALAMSESLSTRHVCCLEQPLSAGDKSHWRTLADLADIPLMADESLVSHDDALYLAKNDLVDYFNIRINKNGGLMPSLRLAELALNYGRGYQLGAMVGETGILTAAGCHFINMVPEIAFTEVGYGTLLLKKDIVKEKIRFGYAGKLPTLNKPGLGITVDHKLLRRFMNGEVRQVVLD